MDEYRDAIEYEGLVFAATTHGTVFAWNPYGFGTFVFHHNYDCFIHMRVSKFPFTNSTFFLCFQGHVNIPPHILEKIYNQGGDDDVDDHEHEDEQDPYTQWRLATYSDGSPLLVCIQGTADVTKCHILASHALECCIMSTFHQKLELGKTEPPGPPSESTKVY